jgi:hypothetical protein
VRVGRSQAPRPRAPYPGGVDAYWTAVIWSLLPTVVVSLVFFFILRSILRMDRTERKAYARVEAEERAKRGLPPADAAPADR